MAVLGVDLSPRRQDRSPEGSRQSLAGKEDSYLPFEIGDGGAGIRRFHRGGHRLLAGCENRPAKQNTQHSKSVFGFHGATSAIRQAPRGRVKANEVPEISLLRT